ncbi:MAG: DUF2147 domain-containing protein [Beijerinckiaceae bacterium]|nr:DUF2147 domain-containing protein [Beijerinckiaceae bacterium]MCI0736973.1 DUF2147 domain-containing protein [Beijerinckiaceae bacterium]
MKTLGFAMALTLISGAAHAGAVFEVPINGGIARIQLGDDCEQPVCASVSWTENEPRQVRKDPQRKKTAKPAAAAKAESAPAPSLPPPDPSAGADSATGQGSSSSLTGTAPAHANTLGGGASEELPEVARHNPQPQAAPPVRDETPKAEAAAVPPQPADSAAKTSAKNPVGEWLVEGGEGRVRIEECGSNLCGVVSAAKNANDTDRKNPNPRLRGRPIVGLPVLLDMKPVERNLWEGRIYNAKNGQTYIASISLDNPQKLRVEGCAFGGLICGNRTWTRVN